MAETGSSSGAAGGAAQSVREVTVLAADDHESFQVALRQLLEATPGFTLVGQSATGEEAIDAVSELHPDLALIDVNMPGMGGVAAARTIAEQHPGVVVWLISIDRNEDLAELARSSGADGYLPKQDLRPRLLRKMWATHRG
jgi:DNA-binding NarL/FixJ family response regulator